MGVRILCKPKHFEYGIIRSQLAGFVLSHHARTKTCLTG